MKVVFSLFVFSVQSAAQKKMNMNVIAPSCGRTVNCRFLILSCKDSWSVVSGCLTLNRFTMDPLVSVCLFTFNLPVFCSPGKMLHSKVQHPQRAQFSSACTLGSAPAVLCRFYQVCMWFNTCKLSANPLLLILKHSH